MINIKRANRRDSGGSIKWTIGSCGIKDLGDLDGTIITGEFSKKRRFDKYQASKNRRDFKGGQMGGHRDLAESSTSEIGVADYVGQRQQ